MNLYALLMVLVLVTAVAAALIAGAVTIAPVRGSDRRGGLWAPRIWWVTAGICGGIAALLLVVATFAQHL